MFVERLCERKQDPEQERVGVCPSVQHTLACSLGAGSPDGGSCERGRARPRSPLPAITPPSLSFHSSPRSPAAISPLLFLARPLRRLGSVSVTDTPAWCWVGTQHAFLQVATTDVLMRERHITPTEAGKPGGGSMSEGQGEAPVPGRGVAGSGGCPRGRWALGEQWDPSSFSPAPPPKE